MTLAGVEPAASSSGSLRSIFTPLDMVTSAGVEPAAFPFGGERSNPLSYEAKISNGARLSYEDLSISDGARLSYRAALVKI